MIHGPSPEVIAGIRDALLAGQSWAVIGRRIGKSKNSMSGIISRHVYPRYPTLQAELAAIRPPPPPSAASDALSLYRDGVPIRQIRDRLGLSKDRLERIIRKSGVPRRQPRAPRNPSLHAPNTIVPIVRAPEPEPVAAPLPEPQVRQCQWPTTRGRRHEFLCADAAELGYPYCDRHCGIAYNNWRRVP